MIFQKYFIAFCMVVIGFKTTSHAQNSSNNVQTKVLITTSYGDIRVVLYNETPIHRDNFIKLSKEHYFDSLLFHRVIKGFMIQGGDPDSKHAPTGTLLGEGGPSYTLPAEFNPKLFHKKGVLAAAREFDLENPTRASSGSQFYIVQGRVFTDSLLNVQAKRITRSMALNHVINNPENADLLGKYKDYSKRELMDSVKYVNSRIDKKVDLELLNITPYSFSKEQKEIYTTIGGTPHLDTNYTIFGEVYEGLEIVDKIAAQPTDKNNRPEENIRILNVSIIP
ncbi:MAG TPA: peptidylprolyl isomerase [Bacteroidia bacterium]|jgi:cyclophilin family peptidyl-prolyl cis-trans isomerase|nr:peptidylprolyl isomerase [Bacteroidia bacterium]HRG52574.1 peptidylprolyl isomerase [Bacteroidia bacterium]